MSISTVPRGIPAATAALLERDLGLGGEADVLGHLALRRRSGSAAHASGS